MSSFSCCHCDARLATKASLRRHERKHSVDAQCLDCPKCTRKFYRKDHLVCAAAFHSFGVASSAIIDHLLILPITIAHLIMQSYHLATVHAGVDHAHACTLCRRRYRCKSSLQRHMRVHHAQHLELSSASAGPACSPTSSSASSPVHSQEPLPATLDPALVSTLLPGLAPNQNIMAALLQNQTSLAAPAQPQPEPQQLLLNHKPTTNLLPNLAYPATATTLLGTAPHLSQPTLPPVSSQPSAYADPLHDFLNDQGLDALLAPANVPDVIPSNWMTTGPWMTEVPDMDAAAAEAWLSEYSTNPSTGAVAATPSLPRDLTYGLHPCQSPASLPSTQLQPQPQLHNSQGNIQDLLQQLLTVLRQQQVAI
ncbi:uncharacterized protein MONBRDRAFT_9879 [Monosiga brevicollis MX1]|uniref:C2H2-type domain-containing protein n=1 Tax=Monosiga brevicollis TaxID=81824 RepID=A9V4I1_MONBE|nr:uncharacterized protein MONBRDRAFT_9879 [Monosiga brevicollis MX1]EDQ87715.1 predicted protein [Monosiga brevicollis MX1]|eukprot:XP_001747635.1 hypothetical protein [Monosiga brevicollis MX1]